MTFNIYSWHPVLTPHQAFTLRALGQAMGKPVHAVVATREHPIRRAQGWPTYDETLLAVDLLPKTGWLKHIDAVLDSDPSGIHLFSSPFERSRINWALMRAAMKRRPLFLVSEPYCPRAVAYLRHDAQWHDSLKAALRPALYRAYCRVLRRATAGVFAISPLAVSQYRSGGIQQVFPFGYFVPGAARPAAAARIDEFNVAYLGSFIARKGISTLMEAFRMPEVVASGARLTMFGPQTVDAIHPPEAANVRYGGPLPFGEVQATLSKFDLLVVPSLYDGWAVVVNEALQAGTPVLASDAVGAAALVERWGCGALFPAGNAAALARQLTRIAQDRATLMQWRDAAERLAPILDPEVAGAYMAECICASLAGRSAPEAPWY